MSEKQKVDTTTPRTARRKNKSSSGKDSNKPQKIEKTEKKMQSKKSSKSKKQQLVSSNASSDYSSDDASSPVHQTTSEPTPKNPRKTATTTVGTTPKKTQSATTLNSSSSVKKSTAAPVSAKKRKNSLKDSNSSRKKKKKDKNCDSDLEKNDYDSDVEFEEDDEFLRPKVARLGDLFKEHKGKICLFTGAGISSSAGLKTYRGKDGIWLKQQDDSTASKNSNNDGDGGGNNLTYFPTLTHMAIKKLYDMGYISSIITQNSDNLHWKSGIDEKDMIEIHGNSYKEYCEKCDKSFIRPDIIVHPTSESIFRNVMNKNENFIDDHLTVNKCEHCGEQLKDVIVNFGEKLSETLWKKAVQFVENSTLVLAIGTKLSVEPVNSLVTLSNNLIICNLQLTPFNDNASLVIRCKSDELFSRLMGKIIDNFIIDIPEYVYSLDLILQNNNDNIELKSEQLNALDQVLLNNSLILNSNNQFTIKNDQLGDVELNSISIRINLRKFAPSCSLVTTTTTSITGDVIEIGNFSQKIQGTTRLAIQLKFHSKEKTWESIIENC